MKKHRPRTCIITQPVNIKTRNITAIHRTIYLYTHSDQHFSPNRLSPQLSNFSPFHVYLHPSHRRRPFLIRSQSSLFTVYTETRNSKQRNYIVNRPPPYICIPFRSRPIKQRLASPHHTYMYALNIVNPADKLSRVRCLLLYRSIKQLRF